MQQNEQPTRIIYAKLTTTGAYDVVAHTSGVRLDEARTLAERLLPGNPPMDAGVDEVIGYLRTAGTGHIVLRFARYAWKDGDRGDVYSTDILLLPDDAFRRARCNPFAVVPRTDRVFDVLTELPTPAVDARTAADEHARIAELAGVREDARTVIANALAAEPVLLLYPGSAAAVLELFTLLLPPSLRPELTFLTQTFRVPAIVPRVTVVDRQAANLRGGTWTVLPSPQVDVPMQLAGLLIALAEDPALLALTHELYDDAYGSVTGEPRALRTGVERVVRLAGLAGALGTDDVSAALRRLAEPETEPRERTAGMQRVRAGDPAAVRAALVDMLRAGGAAAAQVQTLIAADEQPDPATMAALIAALPVGAPTELVLALARRAAAEGNVPQLIELLARDRRAVAAQLARSPGRVPHEFSRLLDALRRAMAPDYDIAAAAQLLTDAAALRTALTGGAADTLHGICRHTVDDALQHVPAHMRLIAKLRQLLDAADAYRAAHADVAAQLPLPLDTDEDAQQFATTYPQPCCAAVGAALLDRALDAHAAGDGERCARDVALAQTLVQSAGASARELVRQLLAQRGVSEHDLVAVPGTAGLLPLLGGTASQALVTRRIVTAVANAAEREDGIAELAAAVYAAHTQHIRITPGSDTSQRVIDGLHAFGRGGERSSAGAELCLELLAVITPPDHMPAFEDAALGQHMTVRLRRLDRSIAVCRAAEDEQRYDRIAEALESGRAPLESDARERLARALGTGGISRRLMRMVASVVEKEPS